MRTHIQKEQNGKIKSEWFGTYDTYETGADGYETPPPNAMVFVSHEYGGFPVNEVFPLSELPNILEWNEIHIRGKDGYWVSLYKD